MRKQSEDKNVKISTEEIQIFFEKFGLIDCYLIKKNDIKLRRSIFRITEDKMIIAEWDNFEIEPIFHIGNKTYSFINFFDFLFYNLMLADQDNIRDLYISFSSNRNYFVNQVIKALNDKINENVKETISKYVKVKHINLSKKYFLKAEIIVETEDGEKEYEVVSCGTRLRHITIKSKNEINTISFASILEDIENNLKSYNYVFPSKISNDYYGKCLIFLLILEKYENSKEYKMILLYEPDFVQEWKKMFELY
jgi:hypothetical protein